MIGYFYLVFKVLNFLNIEFYNILLSFCYWCLNFLKLKVLDLSNNYIGDLIIFIDYDFDSFDKGVINL